MMPQGRNAPSARPVRAPDLITTAEAAERLGVTPRRVRALVKLRPDFPRPAVRRPNLLLWNAAEVEHWAATADRKPGRRWAAPIPEDVAEDELWDLTRRQ
jgi:predicted DNA-binding transcriptional regulator AlpA